RVSVASSIIVKLGFLLLTIALIVIHSLLCHTGYSFKLSRCCEASHVITLDTNGYVMSCISSHLIVSNTHASILREPRERTESRASSTCKISWQTSAITCGSQSSG